MFPFTRLSLLLLDDKAKQISGANFSRSCRTHYCLLHALQSRVCGFVGPPVSFNKSAIFCCVCACIHVVAKEQKFGSNDENTKTPHEWQTKIPTPIYNTIAASKAEYIPSRLCLCGRVILVMNDVTCKRIGS